MQKKTNYLTILCNYSNVMNNSIRNKKYFFFFICSLIFTLKSNILYSESHMQYLPRNTEEPKDIQLSLYSRNNFNKSGMGEIHITAHSANLYSIRVIADTIMEYLWIFKTTGNDTLLSYKATEYQRDLSNGLYEFITGFKLSKHRYKFIYKKGISVNKDTTIMIESSEAYRKVILKFNREDNSFLHINSLGFSFLSEAIGLGLHQTHLTLDSTEFLFHYNDLPDYFINSWLIKGKQSFNNGNLYLINNYLYEAKGDTLISNEISNLVFGDFYYHFVDSLEKDHPEVQIGTNAPGFHYYPSDPVYYLPVHFRIFQDTSADFSLYQSRFSQTGNVTSTIGDDLKTSEMRIGQNKVIGYFTPDEYHQPFIVSEQNTVHIGVTPTYCCACFDNTADSIKIRRPFGFIKAHQLFLSQTNDVIRHFPIQVKITCESKIITDTLIYPIFNGEGPINRGFHVDDLSYKTSSTFNQVILSNKYSVVAKHPAITTATAEFNLHSQDRNPPFLMGFQILSDMVITNTLTPEAKNIIRIVANDDQKMIYAKLYYAKYKDSSWIELLMEDNGPYKQIELPVLEFGYYSVKIILCDTSMNTFENVMEPAFHMGELTSINTEVNLYSCKSINISKAFPNPFNSFIQFELSVLDNFKHNIEVSIYNLLGQKIFTLLNENPVRGNYKLFWNGTNSISQPVASGFYFIQMKGGGIKHTQRVLLIK